MILLDALLHFAQRCEAVAFFEHVVRPTGVDDHFLRADCSVNRERIAGTRRADANVAHRIYPYSLSMIGRKRQHIAGRTIDLCICV